MAKSLKVDKWTISSYLNNMDELWKDIPNYEGYYEVSSLGNFRAKDRYIDSRWGGKRLYHGKPLLTELMEDGYSRIVLMKDGKKKRYMTHRLVALAFIPNPNNLPQVNHLDGNRHNNVVSNLEWCTQSENEIHAVHVLGKCMKNKTTPKPVKCIETKETFQSMNQVILWLGKPSCIEGLHKAIKANRKYHDYTFIFI